MESKTYCIILAAVIVLVVVLAAAYEEKWLNRFLPAKWQKQGFVGAFGRTPGMQNCLAFGGAGQKWSHFNRCTYA